MPLKFTDIIISNTSHVSILKLSPKSNKLMENIEQTLCLASGSLSRKELLERANIRFEMIPADISEEPMEGEQPHELVLRLAQEKARHVLSKSASSVIVAADSLAVYQGEVIGKPSTEIEAIKMISELQGRTHEFLTGLVCLNSINGEERQRIISTKVSMSPMDEEQIADYVKTFQPFRFAGGYEMSGISSWMVESIEGSHSNVTGLPMAEMRQLIEQFGFQWFDFVKK
jgi:septum formation protein